MSFFLATLNPGRKTRKKKFSHRKRKLSWWQKMVKKHGGVSQAVKALRKSKRKRRSAKKRRVVRSGRPRKNARRFSMARTRRRRRGGARKARRIRRNVWKGQPRRHRKAAKLGWSRRRRRKGGTVRRRRRSRSHSYTPTRYHAKAARRRRYAANAVVPVSWNGRKRRKHYRRNSVLATSWNPTDVLGATLGRVKKFIDVNFWIDTAAPAAGGFAASKVIGAMIYEGLDKVGLVKALPLQAVPYVRIAANAAGGAALAWAFGKFVDRKWEQPIWLGTVVAVAHDVLRLLIGGTDIGKAIGFSFSGMGNDLEERMKAAVERRVAELAGVGTYLNQTDLQRQMSGYGEFVTNTGLQRQPGYAASPGADLRDYDVARTETAF